MNVRPQETAETSESAEQAAARRLDDATYEPQALVEQTGEYKQAEAIQQTFITLMNNTAAEAVASGAAPAAEAQAVAAIAGKEDTVAGNEPKIVEGVLTEAPKGDDGGEDITPINLPKIAAAPDVDSGTPSDSAPAAAAIADDRDTVAGNMPSIIKEQMGKPSGGQEEATPVIPLPPPYAMVNERMEKPSGKEDATTPVIPIPPPFVEGSGELTGQKIAGEGQSFKFDEATQAAVLRQTGAKFDEAGQAAVLGQTGEKWDEAGRAAVLRQTGVKFDEAGQAATLRQTGEKFDEAAQAAVLRQTGEKFDEATRAAALRQTGEKFDEAGQAAVLRQTEEKFDEAGQAAVLRQTGEKFDEAGEAAVLRRESGFTGREIPESELQERLRQAEAIGVIGKGRIPAGSRQPETGAVPTGGQSAPASSETGSSSPLNTGEGPGTSAATTVAADSDLADSAEKNLSEGEASPEWTPPEVYVAVGPDGKFIVVDANGVPIDSPPLIQQVAGDKGETWVFGRYVDLDGDKLFWIPYLERDFQGCTVGLNPDGNLTVFGTDGKALSAQPMIQKTFDANGDATYLVYNVDSSGTTSPITLFGYTGSLSGVSVYKTESGKLLAVDANGEPLAVQPHIDITFAQTGEDIYNVWYPTSKNLMSKPVVLTAFTASLEGVSVHVGANGKTTAVDKDGNPLTAQPKILDLGDGSFRVFYPGSKDQITTASYTASLEGVTIHKGADGTLTAYDSNGKALASQPLILIDFDQQGNEVYRVWYGKSEYVESSQITVGAYNASLQNVFVSLDQNGNPIAVDENGEPLAAQPLFQRIEGMADTTIFRAYYPGGQSVLMDYYLPESGGSGTSQYLWK